MARAFDPTWVRLSRQAVRRARSCYLGGVPSDHHGFIPSAEEEMLRRRVKAELRKRLRGLRKALPAASCAERSARIVEALLTLEPVASARGVALFYPMTDRHEVDLRPLDAKLRAGGVRVAYPAIDREANTMLFRFVSDPESMAEEGGGFREPSSADPVATKENLDVIVVPALGVDPSGHRIGYGAGYYDRALPSHAPPAVTVAVAFDFQLLAEIPATQGDVAVDWAVTDARVIRAARV
jgi:5-formyltetrahydrofolate cyclo-ligase